MTAPLQSHELRIEVNEDDLPDDRFSNHVNNARYFAFINRTFHGWYVAMGIRDRTQPFAAVMASTTYDFLREVNPPGAVLCRIRVDKVGRSSMEHTVEIWDVGAQAEPLLAGRGRVRHVWIERAVRQSRPWPAELLARCWDSGPQSGPQGGPLETPLDTPFVNNE